MHGSLILYPFGGGALVPADRLLHPRAGHSDKVTLLTDMEYRVWTQYLLSADDFGVMRCSAVTLQADNDALAARKPVQLTRALQALIDRGLVRPFEHQGRRYIYQHDWNSYQKVTFPRRTDNPTPPVGDIAQCDEATQDLFAVHPGGKRAPRRPEKLPENLGSDSERTSEIVPTESAPPHRLTLTANGKRLTANGSEGGAGETAAPPIDAWTREFLSLYPKQGRCGWNMVERPLYEVLTADPAVQPAAAWEALKGRLDGHIRSARWTEAGGKFIPRADRYLREGTHTQEMAPPALAATGTDSRTPQWVIDARAEQAKQAAKS